MKDYLVGGVNSPVRTFRGIDHPPLIIRDGRGPYLRDLEGRRYIDCIMGWGSLILGRAHPAVTAAIARAARAGSPYGLTAPAEVELARLVAQAMPSIEQVRFTVSGTEADMTAIRLARAATKRTKILTFEGCYHGHSDGVLVKRGSGLATLGLSGSAGVPALIARETLVLPLNDVAALEQACREFGSSIAGIILEPVPANMGVVVPEPGFLRRVRQLATQIGAVLIFDEVVTGFRLGLGGAQGRFGVRPDLTVLGKIIGGGCPIGAVGGARGLMGQLAPEGPVYHAGTFAGHPISMAAGIAVLSRLAQHPPYAALETAAQRIDEVVTAAAERRGIPVQVNRLGSMLTVFFSAKPVKNFAAAQASDRGRFGAFARELLARGVLIPPSPFEAMFLSAAHTASIVDRAATAMARAIAKLA